MITSLALENFKCFRSVSLDMRPITVLIGPNGSGKSSIVQSMMLLRQSLGEEQLNLHTPLTDIVSMGEATFSGDTSSAISLLLGLRRGIDEFDIRSQVRLVVAHDGNVMLQSNEVESNRVSFTSSWSRGIASERSHEFDVEGVSVRLRTSGRIGRPFTLRNVQAREERRQRAYERLINASGLVWEQEIASWRFVPAIRGFTQASTELAAAKLDELLPSVTNDEASAQVASTLAYDDDIEQQVGDWIRRITGVSVRHKILEGPRVSPRVGRSGSNNSHSVINEGFGTNQLIFMMFQLATTGRAGLVAIEEPETHLHPFAIARLADLLVEIAKQKNVQLVLTTHSEHLLLGLLNNVAEEKLGVDELAVHYFTRDEDESHARMLEVTSEGMVVGGLPGFFDATLEAQRRHMNAIASSV